MDADKIDKWLARVNQDIWSRGSLMLCDSLMLVKRLEWTRTALSAIEGHEIARWEDSEAGEGLDCDSCLAKQRIAEEVLAT